MTAILLVDDDPAHRLLTKRLIRTGFANELLIEAGSVAESQKRVEECVSELSIVVLDLNLGQESGLATLRWIRDNAHTKHIPVVVVSTSCLEGDIFASYAQGADCYIIKSGNKEEYQHALLSAIGFCRRMCA